jgi:hypothetical protein
MKWTKENKWNKDDSIITLYFTKFGTKYLPVKDVFELVGKMGMDIETLKNQSVGFGNIINKKNESATKLQKTVIEEFDTKDEKEFREIVIEILDNEERQVIINQRVSLHQDVDSEKKKKEDKKKLDTIFRKMGKDPSKMKSLGTHLKEVE